MNSPIKIHGALRRLSIAGLLAGLLAGVPAHAHQPLADGSHASTHAPLPHGDHENVNDRVQQLVQRFRVSGDDRFLDHAWDLLHERIASPNVDQRTLVSAAFVAQSRHRFDRALELVSRALEAGGDGDEARLLLASVHRVRGEYEQAVLACRGLSKASPLVILTCKAAATPAGAAELADTYNRLLGVLQLEAARTPPDEVLAWSYSVAGDLAVANGDGPGAIALYGRSLKLAESSQVRSALVDVHLALGETAAAKAQLAVESQALPLLVRRLIVAKRQGELGDHADRQHQLDHEFRHWIEQGDWLHAREMARYYLDVADQPALARRLALINVELQKEPEDLRLVARSSAAAARTDGD